MPKPELRNDTSPPPGDGGTWNGPEKVVWVKITPHPNMAEPPPLGAPLYVYFKGSSGTYYYFQATGASASTNAQAWIGLLVNAIQTQANVTVANDGTTQMTFTHADGFSYSAGGGAVINDTDVDLGGASNMVTALSC